MRLQPHDPFDLIRLLARSQSDPRKALAELVQNSLDAGARRIEIEWFNSDGRRALRVWDDGEGVFPGLEREDALRRIAHTIGHSHKRDLTPMQRREQMVLGQYGIGLIGFWSVGEVLELKSRVDGGKPLVLRLREDKSQGELAPSRARLVGEPDTFTEVTIRGVHPAAVNKIRPPRLQAYLANELRGQLLEREATVRIRDRVARGRAKKEFKVEPRPYLGRPLERWRELDVPGFESARLELYLVGTDEERRGAVALSCGGTVVLEDIAEIDGSDQRRAPWSSGRLEGVIDFPELHVSPASRRGFAHDEPVEAFLAALDTLERALVEQLEHEQERRSDEQRESTARDIRRAFRAVARRLPEYEFFGVASRGPRGRTDAHAAGSTAPHAAASERDESSAPDGEALAAESEREPPAAREAPQRSSPGTLFPPGPLARLEVTPRSLRLGPLVSRTLRVRPLDADGVPCAGEVDIAWQLFGPGQLEPDGARAVYTAPEALEPDGDAGVRVRAVATQGDLVVECDVHVTLTVPADVEGSAAGIPEPVAVSAPSEAWRSRLVDGRWEYNDAHRDYLAVAEVEARRLRYLIHLFAKAVVLKNFGRPGDADVLERMIEVLTCLDVGVRK